MIILVRPKLFLGTVSGLDKNLLFQHKNHAFLKARFNILVEGGGLGVMGHFPANSAGLFRNDVSSHSILKFERSDQIEQGLVALGSICIHCFTK